MMMLVYATNLRSIKSYRSAESLLDETINPNAGCMIVENCLPGMSGIELMGTLQQQGISLPTILLARFSDVPTAVKAMQAGAVDFIDKPFVDRVLLARVQQVLNAKCMIHPLY
jgi:two-component system response regulator FixJ